MIKKYKVKVIKDIEKIFKNMKLLIILNIKGICAQNMRHLRYELYKENIYIKVFKNKLIKYAIKNSIFNTLTSSLTGQNAFLWDNNNALTATKIINNFDKKINKLKLVCGFLNGKKIDVDYIEYLSNIPNISILRIKLLFLLSIISRKLIYYINYQLLVIINILKQKA